MSDQDKTATPAAPAKAPAAEPLPQVGGSYRRNADGTLTPVEGPGTLPENQPAKPDPKPAQE